MSESPLPLWLDCDPGHDDAFAILLAALSKEVKLLGISIVHGNDTVEHCSRNAQRFMWACGVHGIPVYLGVNKPIVRQAKHCPEIHGSPGKDGVAGMCGYHFPDEKIVQDAPSLIQKGHGVIKMVETIESYPQKVTIVATGGHTNLALAIRMFPQIEKNVEKIVFMGGAIGLGNTGVAAEFNIEIDPEAVHVVLHSGMDLVMIPLEVTHSVLVTPQILETISQIDNFSSHEFKYRNIAPAVANPIGGRHHVEYPETFNRLNDIAEKIEVTITDTPMLKCVSEFSNCCVQLLTFFQSTYKTVFAFDSPPLHDPCAVFYCINPTAFRSLRTYVDVELGSEKCFGRTLCDLHGITKKAPQVTVCFSVDVEAFWKQMLTCLKLANESSPLNK